jgi:hypothetical protein
MPKGWGEGWVGWVGWQGVWVGWRGLGGSDRTPLGQSLSDPQGLAWASRVISQWYANAQKFTV